MIELAQEVEGWETMEAVELMVRMTELGYEMEAEPNRAVASLNRELKNLTDTH